MKKMILALGLLLSFIANANDCSHVGRATTTDQKSMAHAIAFKYLGLKTSEVIRMETSQYVSWKTNQEMCLADVIHYARVRVEARDGVGRRCITELNLHTKDYFVGQVEYSREYKARDVETNCFEENVEQSAQRLACESMPKCPVKRDGVRVRDLYNNCECSYVLDLVDFEDVTELYEGFFSPQNEFNKPQNLQSPF
jgi:hypothetical protein